MKVDVEGAELLVFRGVRATLDRKDAPILVYESNVFAAPLATREPAPAATAYLGHPARARDRCFLIWDWNPVTRLVPGQYVHANLLATPEAGVDRWPELATADVLQMDAARE
jgi:hypothetical protein